VPEISLLKATVRGQHSSFTKHCAFEVKMIVFSYSLVCKNIFIMPV
jgi:hypothetical protein